MDIISAEKFVRKQIGDLEHAVYIFETVVAPRAEVDKKILAQMREQHLKLQALMDKVKRKEPVTNEEYIAAVPSQFR